MKQFNFNIFLSIALIFCTVGTKAQTEWTIMHYAVGSNSSEVDLLDDIQEMQDGKRSDGYNVITLIDRTPGHSEDSIALGENFDDTRLYQLNLNSFKELDGGALFPELDPGSTYDANMADAHTLKKFIQYCKTNFPAKHYLLVLRSHGNGYSMCPDPEFGSKDELYPAEIQDVLTDKESVDILGLDVCSMAGLENLYEWRPNRNGKFSADYVIASAPLSAAWAYDDIFNRLSSSSEKIGTDENYFVNGEEENLNPHTMTPLAFSKMLMEEIYDSQRWASWGLFDNTKSEDVKQLCDELARLLSTEDKEVVIRTIKEALGYFHNTSNNIEIAQLTFPYVDAYDFFKRISETGELKEATREKASEVCNQIDAMTVYSYYGRGYLPETDRFENNKNGAYLILPMGNKVFSQSKRTFWTHMGWYHPDDKSSIENSYGKYDWCSEGAQIGNNQVDNFFELLDFLFDESNTTSGGVNKYQY